MVTTRSASKRSLSPSAYNNEHSHSANPKRARRRPFIPNDSPSVTHQPVVSSTTTTNQCSSPPSPHSSTICTIGHGTKSLPELIHILQTARSTLLVDIRSIPRSRTNPQFNRDALSSSVLLKEAGIRYKWMGDTLGGRRNAQQPNVHRHVSLRVAAFRNYSGYMGTESFGRGMEELKGLCRREEEEGEGEEDDDDGGGRGGARGRGGVTIMCSETLWWRCHRRMVADKLVAEGWVVRHLGIRAGEPPRHTIWDIARVGEGGELVYDA